VCLHVLEGRDENVAERNDLDISQDLDRPQWVTNVFMPQMLEQLQLPICPLTQHGGRKGFHDFLDGNGSTR